MDAAPLIPLYDLHDIKTGCICALYGVSLRFQQSGQEQVPAGLAGRGQFGRQFDQGSGQYVGYDAEGARQRGFDALHRDARRDTIARSVVPCGDERLMVKIHGSDVRGAEFQRCYAQDARAAPIVDQSSLTKRQGIQYL